MLAAYLYSFFYSYYYHLALSAQYAPLILPFLMFALCRALNDLRFAFMAALSPAFGLPAVFAPCSPKRIVLILSPSLANTTCDLVGCAGVLFGLLNPSTPSFAIRVSLVILSIIVRVVHLSSVFSK